MVGQLDRICGVLCRRIQVCLCVCLVECCVALLNHCSQLQFRVAWHTKSRSHFVFVECSVGRYWNTIQDFNNALSYALWCCNALLFATAIAMRKIYRLDPYMQATPGMRQVQPRFKRNCFFVCLSASTLPLCEILGISSSFVAPRSTSK